MFLCIIISIYFHSLWLLCNIFDLLSFIFLYFIFCLFLIIMILISFSTNTFYLAYFKFGFSPNLFNTFHKSMFFFILTFFEVFDFIIKFLIK